MVYPTFVNMELALRPRRQNLVTERAQILGLPIEEADLDSESKSGDDEGEDADIFSEENVDHGVCAGGYRYVLFAARRAKDT